MFKLTSIQAPNQDFIIAGVATYLAKTLKLETKFIHEPPWQERENLLLQQQIQLGWVCGLPYVQHTARQPAPFELLVAPVMQSRRYQQQPNYFSDVIVHRNSQYSSFYDLRGTSWAFNEPHSHSGYNVTRYHLATLGETGRFFGSVMEAGSHQAAIDMVLHRRIAASAIDSTVLELEILRRPGLMTQLRIIDTFGPSPIPPFVISTRVPKHLRDDIRRALLVMHHDPEGKATLSAGLIDHFVKVTDADYDRIRAMDMKARHIGLEAMEKREG